ncbi:MAG: TetR/AcrR family transcriptional regulator [Myxococcota bacterium]|jgi:AcrR family transcriptional regulator|nr:TetR/AcrR family transcriptional regulator [Myxococcota bacterium]
MSRLPRLTPRKLPQQDRSRALVDAVLAAAKRIVVRDGIVDAKIVDIAELAGVSPGSLYQYFPNLASVVASLHVSLIEDSIADLTDNLLEFREAPIDDVAAVIALVPLRNVRDDVEVHRVLALAAPRLGTERKLSPVFERERTLLRSFFSSRHDVDHLDPESAAFVVTSAVRGCIDAALTETPSRIGAPELDLSLTSLVQRYLARPKA